jgi:uncharacterized protein
MPNPPPIKSLPVPSPCTGVCRIDPRSGWCEGCARTLDEIAAWGSLDAPRQLAIRRQLPERRAALAALKPPER